MHSIPRLRKVLRSPDLPFVVILVLVGVLSHPEWFFSLDPIAVGDWSYLWPQWMQGLVGPPVSWMSEYDLGYYNANAGLHWIQASMGLLSLGGVGFAISERLFFFWPAALLTGLTMYFFARTSIGRIPAMVSGLAYELNTVALFLGGAHLTHAMAYCLAPLLFLFARGAILRSSVRHAISFGLAFALIMAYEPRFAYILGWGSLGYIGLLAWKTPPVVTKRHILLALTMIATPAIVHAYWLVPALLYPAQAFSSVPTKLFQPFITLPYGLALYNPFWSGGRLASFDVQPLPWFAFLLPLFAFCTFLRKRVDAETALFGLVALVGVFLAKQDNPPLAEVYPWLFVNFPGFFLFRESSKFFILTALGYSLLLGSFVLGVASILPAVAARWSGLRLRPRRRVAFVLVIVGLVTAGALAPSQAAFTNSLGYAYNTTNVPPLYTDLARTIDDGSFSRVLWFLTYPVLGFRSNDHPAVNATAFLLQHQNDLPKDRNLSLYLDLLSIEYVVETNDSAHIGDASFDFVRDWYLFITTNIPLEPVSGFPSAEVWRNPGARARLYGLEMDPGGISNDSAVLSAAPVSMPFERIGTNVYRVSLPGTTPQVLVLSEGYDPNWIAEAAGASFPSVPVLGLLTGFVLGGFPGNTVTVRYVVQTAFLTGSVVSLTAIAVSVAFVLRPFDPLAPIHAFRRRQSR